MTYGLLVATGGLEDFKRRSEEPETGLPIYRRQKEQEESEKNDDEEVDKGCPKVKDGK